jgi:hypothetical protein
MADITQIGGGGPVEIDGTFTTTGACTHSGNETYSGTLTYSGTNTFNGAVTQSNHFIGSGKVTANAGGTVFLTDAPYQTVESGTDSHIIRLPAAAAVGQTIFFLNIGTHDVVIKARTGGSTLLTTGQDTAVMCVATAAGDPGTWSVIGL